MGGAAPRLRTADARLSPGIAACGRARVWPGPARWKSVLAVAERGVWQRDGRHTPTGGALQDYDLQELLVSSAVGGAMDTTFGQGGREGTSDLAGPHTTKLWRRVSGRRRREGE